MVEECESLMPEWIVQRKRYDWFPDILVVRRVADTEEIIGGGE